MPAVSACAIPGLSPYAVDFVPHLFHKAGFDRKATLVAYLGGFFIRLPAYCVARIQRRRIDIVVFFHFGLVSAPANILRRTGNSYCLILNNPRKNLLSGAKHRRGRKAPYFSEGPQAKGSVLANPAVGPRGNSVRDLGLTESPRMMRISHRTWAALPPWARGDFFKNCPILDCLRSWAMSA